MPRTKATRFQLSLIKKLTFYERIPITYHKEFHSLEWSVDKLNRSLQENQETLIIKILPELLSEGQLSTIRWDLFDKIYFGRRRKLENQLVSFLIAQKTDQWIRSTITKWLVTTEPITITDEQINQFISSLQKTKAVEQFVCNLNSATEEFWYETEDHEGYSRTIPTGYDYKKLCTNYDYVTERLKNYVW